MGKKSCILSNRLYVPKHLVTQEMKDAYTYAIEDKTACAGCTSYDCDTCTVGRVVIEMYREHEQYISFARGDLGKLHRIFGDFKIEDERSRVPLRYNLRWRKKHPLRKRQKRAVKAWLKFKYGQIKAAARTGKTVMAVNLVTRIRQKTLILTHLDELLTQFETTFRKFTNLNKLERSLGYTILGYPQSPKDFDRFDICLMTYQTFLSKRGQQKSKDYRDYFGFVITDEVHRSSAKGFASVVGRFNPEIRLGLTATPFRKDELHIIHENVVGPVVVQAKAKTLTCKVRWVRTGYNLPDFYNWTTMLSRMVMEEPRNELIAEYAMKDAMNGRSILIVTNRVAHCKHLRDLIEEKGIKTAALWGAAPDRDKILNQCRTGVVKVIVAMRQLIQVGIDVPRWDTYYCAVPINNAPNFYQEMSRIRTPYPGKRDPLIRYFIDNHRAMYACQNTVTSVMKKEGFLN